MDARGERRHVGGLCHAGFDQLGIAGNARQRGFQLMADIGGKLPAHRLVVLPQLAVGLDGPCQGDKLLIGHISLDGVQVLGQVVDRLHHAAGQPPAEQRCSGQNQNHGRAEQRQGVGAQAPDAGNILAHAQHLRTVGRVDAHGVVVGLPAHGLALTGGAGGAVGHGLLELRAVGVAGQVGVHDGVHGVCGIVDKGRGLTVKQHGAVAVDKRKARRINARFRQQADQRFGVVGGLGLVGSGVAAAQLGQVVVHAVGVAALEQNGGRRQHGQYAEHAGQDQAAPIAAGHAQGLFFAALLVSHHCPPCSACSPPCARCG